jgi:2-polyprenyl-3-methyl-5-hydroxy-6-metoxy-1,4-benzoquinol methylase
MARMTFAWRMLRARLDAARRACPYCGSRWSRRLQRKWLLVEARECAHCGLFFRCPTDDPARARQYYEAEYAEKTVVDVPDAAGLRGVLDRRFQGTPFDRSARLTDLAPLLPAGGRVLDFGCSWGYTVWQLASAGFDAVGYEPSARRAEYGRKNLNVRIETDWDALLAAEAPSGFDLVYADHVVEHLVEPRKYLDGWRALLRPGGRALVYVPNGGGEKARRLGTRWGPLVGEPHTLALTATWFRHNLPNHGLVVEHLGSDARAAEGMPDGDELACVARKA